MEILRELEIWYKNIDKGISSSLAIIAPRRMGKTAILDRLVNKVFWEDYRVAPFYFKVKREETTLRKFLLEYVLTFFSQFIAYLLRDPILYRNRSASVEQLLRIDSTDWRIGLVQKFIKDFWERYSSSDHEDARNHWDAMIKVPEDIAAYTGVKVAVIIDEFQDMKFYVYDIDRIPSDRENIPGRVDLTATYDRQSQSRKAPMLVSGSAVTMIFHTVMGGPLAGRFGFKYLKPMSIPDAATLAKKLLTMRDIEISDEGALYLATRVGGHPYYRTAQRYYGFNDPMLLKYIENRYAKDIEESERIKIDPTAAFNQIKARFLELVVESIMHNFNGEELDGSFFGQKGRVKVPTLEYVGNTVAKPPRSSGFHIDVYGIRRRGTPKVCWAVECKYRKEPMDAKEVEKAIAAGHALLQQEHADELTVWVGIDRWLYIEGT